MSEISVAFRPMSADEFSRYIERSIPEYADAHLKAGHSMPEDALKKAQDQYGELLPQGLATPGNQFFTIADANNRANLGMCWFEVKQKQGKTKAFIYDFYLEHAFRGQGLGSQVMEELEKRVRKLGATAIELYVFGDNVNARSLYERCGFRYTDMRMSKELA